MTAIGPTGEVGQSVVKHVSKAFMCGKEHAQTLSLMAGRIVLDQELKLHTALKNHVQVVKYLLHIRKINIFMQYLPVNVSLYHIFTVLDLFRINMNFMCKHFS